MSEFRITKLRRHEEGHWIARVTENGHEPIEVHRRFGSWLADVGENRLRELPRAWSYALQERVRRLEHGERELVRARLAEAAASGRTAARRRGQPSARVPLPLPAYGARVRGRVRSLSHAG